MNEEKILDALEFIDEQYIEDVYALKQTPIKRKNTWIKVAGLVACVALVFVSVIALDDFGYTLFTTDKNYGSTESSAELAEDVNNQTTPPSDSLNDLTTEVFNDSNVYGNSGQDGASTEAVAGNSANREDLCKLIPAYVEIVKIKENGFVLKILDNKGLYDILTENEEYEALYDTDYKPSAITEYKVGDKVYIIYGTKENENQTKIYIKKISYEEVALQ